LWDTLKRSPQKSATPNLRPQAAAASHGLFRSGGERRVHPIAGATFFGAKKVNALELKLDFNQFVQTNPAGDHVPTKNFRAAIPNPKLQTKILIRLFLEESDLAFVPFLVAEVPVPGDPFSDDALNLCRIDCGMVTGRLFVMTEVVVPGGNEQMKDLKINANHDRKYSPAEFFVKSIEKKAEFRRQNSGVAGAR
jgi:hypothetical protein